MRDLFCCVCFLAFLLVILCPSRFIVLQAATAVRASASAAPASTTSGSQQSLVQLGAESFLNGTGGVYAEEMFRAWKADPKR
jgi:hypothetical protein